MNNTFPATKVRAQFFKMIEDANQPGSSLTITVEGEPKVVMMPVADFEGWQETLEVMSDKKLLSGINKGLKDAKTGNLRSEDEVKKALNL
ncbi:type II toxin-antitoxin system Phd/YefM family antitoxin [Candidatus Peregrinibacteria bacterium]|nr:type II toxin-antitoxin system Phd/YefM family antitoxin [Candidatus Peregrinibacteria bacterium]